MQISFSSLASIHIRLRNVFCDFEQGMAGGGPPGVFIHTDSLYRCVRSEENGQTGPTQTPLYTLLYLF